MYLVDDLSPLISELCLKLFLILNWSCDMFFSDYFLFVLTTSCH